MSLRLAAVLSLAVVSTSALAQKESGNAFAAIARQHDARLAARAKQFEAAKTRYGPMTTWLVETLKAYEINVDGYLAASKTFAETPAGKLAPGTMEKINATYAEEIRNGMAKALGNVGVADILRDVHTPAPPLVEPGGPPPPPPGETRCTTTPVDPPWRGLYSEGRYNARSIHPDPVTMLDPKIRSAVADAPHALQASTQTISVPRAGTVTVGVTLPTSWVIGMSGLGYAHVWLSLDMNVARRDGGVVCSAPRLEQDNRWTWAGGHLTLFNIQPGPVVTRTCTFTRAATDPSTFDVNVSAAVDGTFVGFSGGYGDYYVTLGRVTVTTCSVFDPFV